METWKQFIENKKEKAEEKNGLDLDHDKEKGEPKHHQEAVKKAKKKMLEFFQKRRAGAAKIASEAHTKGGPAELTYWHFRSKDRCYQEVIFAIKNDRDESYFVQKCHEFVNKLKFNKLKQKDIQEILGKLEVFAEATAQLFN